MLGCFSVNSFIQRVQATENPNVPNLVLIISSVPFRLLIVIYYWINKLVCLPNCLNYFIVNIIIAFSLRKIKPSGLFCRALYKKWSNLRPHFSHASCRVQSLSSSHYLSLFGKFSKRDMSYFSTTVQST